MSPVKSRPEFLADVPACDPSRVRVAVLMGGLGSEREVSLMSGREVGKALREAGFQVQDIDLKPEHVAGLAGLDFEVAFIALHGPFGEGGPLQDQLDAMGILYVGSGGEASRKAMDKVAAKKLFVAAGLPTPPWQVVGQGDDDAAAQAYQALGPEVVVKPIDDGSSVAVTLVGHRQRYAEGLAEVFALHDKALVERQVFGRELTVGVLHGQGMPVVEIVPTQQFYNYEAKYFDDTTDYIVNPELDFEVQKRIRQSAVAAHRVLGCRGFSRVDMILDSDGEAPILEVNTIPGFTTHSLLPKSASGAGIDFACLCRYIVEIALCRGGRCDGR